MTEGRLGHLGMEDAGLVCVYVNGMIDEEGQK